MQKPLSCQRGFTLIELLFALVIFAIGMLSIMTMQMSAMGSNAASRSFEVATGLAEAKVEEFRSLPWDHPAFEDGGGNGAAGLDDEGEALADGFESVTFDGNRYEISWNLDEDFPVAEVKTIRVIVRWKDPTSRRIVLDSLKARSVM